MRLWTLTFALLAVLVLGEGALRHSQRQARATESRLRLFAPVPADQIAQIDIRAANRQWRYVLRDSTWRFPAYHQAFALDRRIEHLGTADAMIIRVRRRLLEAARALRDHGTVPPGVDDPNVYMEADPPDDHLIQAIRHLAERPLDKVKGWGAKSAENLYQAIEDKRKIPLSRLLFALGIRHVGESASALIANHYGTWEALGTWASKLPVPFARERIHPVEFDHGDTRNLLAGMLSNCEFALHELETHQRDALEALEDALGAAQQARHVLDVVETTFREHAA